MASTMISIPEGIEGVGGVKVVEKKRLGWFLVLVGRGIDHDLRKVLHSVKVGIALVLVSLLYLLDPLYRHFGDNAMWAIMTVVVIFEFFAGAVLSKGLNRAIGTILGGGLGCLAAAFSQDVGGIGRAVMIGLSVFVFGAGATYSRLTPNIKKKYDYGVMIFILTFNLVVVSGLRAETVMQLAQERLSTIGMGFAVTISISLLVFPIWASDELHDSTASKFKQLAKTIEGCLEDYFRFVSEKENECSISVSGCKSIMHSKAKDELLANFAKCEPWHGRFGFSYPWKKYLKIGEILRDLTSIVISLKSCLQSLKQPSPALRQSIKEPCEDAGSTLAWSMRELGESIMNMRKSQRVGSKLKSVRVELSQLMSGDRPDRSSLQNGEELAMGSFVFLLMEIVEKMEELAKEVEELGESAGFNNE